MQLVQSSKTPSLCFLCLAFAVVMNACGNDPSDRDGDTSADGDADTDGDTDSDADTDADADADADADSDADADADSDADADADADADSDASSDGSPPDGSAELYGEVIEGVYHLGPVDFAETEWHNACAPGGGYRAELRDTTGLGGEYLAGVSTSYHQGGGICDACIYVATAEGNSIVARVVTYGDTGPGDIDVSPSVYQALNEDEWPRNMTWQLAKCPDTGPIVYEFQTEAHQWWSSLWVRNARVPIERVEVQSANHPEFFELSRGGDGTLTDSGGFGAGAFTLRVTAIDGQTIEDTFDSFPTGQLVTSSGQFE